MLTSILIQLIGIVAFILITVSYWFKKKLWFIIFQLCAYILYALHYFLLGGLAGTWCNLIGVIILFLLLYKEKSKNKCYFLIPIILLLFVPGIIFFYDGLISLVPVVATLIPMIANWNKNMLIVKIGGIIGAISWLIYGISVLSYATILTNVIFVSSTLVSILYKREVKHEI